MISRAVFGLFCCWAAAGQVPEALPAFDVASVKTHTSPMGPIETGTSKHGTVIFGNASMKLLIRYAYGLASIDQISGPDWTDLQGERYDIVAKAPADTPQDRLLLMTQRLLADRFHLVMHQESRPLAHLDLEVADGGLKLTPSLEEPDPSKDCYARGLLDYFHEGMDDIALLLSLQTGQVVMNRTAANGFYDIKLEWQPEGPNAGATPLSGDTKPELSEALATVGLKLTASKSPIPVFVIDHAERVPVGN